MGRRRHHKNDSLARLESTVAVDDQRGVEIPAAARLCLDLGELLLGHAGIVLERHRADALAAGHVTDQPDETRDATDLMVATG